SFLNCLVAAQFHGHLQVRKSESSLFQCSLEAVPQTRPDLSEDEGVTTQLPHRHLLVLGEWMTRWDNGHDAVQGKEAKLQMRGVGLASNEAKTRFAPFDLGN